LGYIAILERIFSSSNGLGKYAIGVYVAKYFNIAILFRMGSGLVYVK